MTSMACCTLIPAVPFVLLATIAVVAPPPETSRGRGFYLVTGLLGLLVAAGLLIWVLVMGNVIYYANPPGRPPVRPPPLRMSAGVLVLSGLALGSLGLSAWCLWRALRGYFNTPDEDA